MCDKQLRHLQIVEEEKQPLRPETPAGCDTPKYAAMEQGPVTPKNPAPKQYSRTPKCVSGALAAPKRVGTPRAGAGSAGGHSGGALVWVGVALCVLVGLLVCAAVAIAIVIGCRYTDSTSSSSATESSTSAPQVNLVELVPHQKMAATANNSFVELTADGEVSAAGGADCKSLDDRPDGCPCSKKSDCANQTLGCAFYPGQKKQTTCGGKAPVTPGPPAPAGQCSGKDDKQDGCTCISNAQCKKGWCHGAPNGSNTCGGVNPSGPSPGGDFKIGTLVFMPNNSGTPDINEWDRAGAMSGKVGTVIAPIWSGWGGSDADGLPNVNKSVLYGPAGPKVYTNAQSYATKIGATVEAYIYIPTATQEKRAGIKQYPYNCYVIDAPDAPCIDIKTAQDVANCLIGIKKIWTKKNPGLTPVGFLLEKEDGYSLVPGSKDECGKTMMNAKAMNPDDVAALLNSPLVPKDLTGMKALRYLPGSSNVFDSLSANIGTYHGTVEHSFAEWKDTYEPASMAHAKGIMDPKLYGQAVANHALKSSGYNCLAVAGLGGDVYVQAGDSPLQGIVDGIRSVFKSMTPWEKLGTAGKSGSNHACMALYGTPAK